ncbi:MBG domain-containing protein [Sphingobacterium tabacisoli]|uniref:MBG domain-containing protein n=1 Tax=Sphingobacterium tabacisoli TaxID=2044855 RepID=A0ABW5L539_9SPHI|nr:MBG domain-containing protein [Sphingobacterium tabacisoli]
MKEKYVFFILLFLLSNSVLGQAPSHIYASEDTGIIYKGTGGSKAMEEDGNIGYLDVGYQGTFGVPMEAQVLLKYNLPAIPEGYKVESANLYFPIIGGTIQSAANFSLKAAPSLNHGWVQDAVNTSTLPAPIAGSTIARSVATNAPTAKPVIGPFDFTSYVSGEISKSDPRATFILSAFTAEQATAANITSFDHYIQSTETHIGGTERPYLIITYTEIVEIKITGVTDGGLYNSNVTPHFNVGTATLNGHPFNSGTIISTEGTYTLSVTAGNQIKIIQFTIDKTRPTATVIINNGSYFTNHEYVDVRITPDPGVTDIVSMRYSVNDSPVSTTQAYQSRFSIGVGSENGAKSVKVQLIDAAGNISPLYFWNFALNTTIPTGSLMINNRAAYTTAQEVDILITPDASANEIVTMQFSADNNTWSPIEDYNPSKRYTLPLGDGDKIVYVRLVDRFGNVGILKQSILLDMNGPTIASVVGSDNRTYKKNDVLAFTVTFDEEVEVTGTPYLEVSIGTKTVQAVYSGGNGTKELNFKYTVQATDLDLDGIAISSLKLNPNDKIVDAVGHNSTLAWSSFPLTTGIIVIGEQADISITMTAQPNPTTYGGRVTATITVSNNGTDEATNVRVKADIPAGFQYISATKGGVYEAGKVNWTFPQLANGGSEKLEIVLEAKSVGARTIAATVESSSHDPDKTNNTKAVAITVAKAALPDFTFADASYTYDGTAKSLQATDLPAGATVSSYTNNGQIEAGVYSVTATIDGGNNYENGSKTATLTITKAALPDFTFANAGYTYDGTTKSLVATNLPAGATVNSYTNNDQTEAGVYSVKATIDGGNNYENGSKTAKLTISKAAQPDFTFADASYTYDGTTKSLVAINLPASATVSSYTNNGQTEVGVYSVTATIDGGNNYENGSKTATLSITKAILPDFTFADANYTYDGTTKSLSATDLPSGATVSSYTNNGQTEVGVYSVTATIDGGNNYVSGSKRAKLTITKAALPDFTFADASYTYDGTAKSLQATDLPAGATVSDYTNNNQTEGGVYSVTATIDGGNNYASGSKTAKLTITKATLPNFTFADANYTYDGTAKSLSATDLPAGATVSSYTNNGQTEAGVYTVTATIDGGNNYENGSKMAKLMITKATQTISFNDPGVLNRDAGTVALDITSSSGLPVSVSVDDASIATISGTNLRVLHLGTVKVTAIQAGNENYEAATAVTMSIRIDAGATLPIIVHQAVSPNGDGINEFLMIEGIGNYPENKVTIFDKNGVVLAEIQGYDNRDRLFFGRGHRDGTYYYYIDLKDGNTWKRERGFFVIRR